MTISLVAINVSDSAVRDHANIAMVTLVGVAMNASYSNSQIITNIVTLVHELYHLHW